MKKLLLVVLLVLVRQTESSAGGGADAYTSSAREDLIHYLNNNFNMNIDSQASDHTLIDLAYIDTGSYQNEEQNNELNRLYGRFFEELINKQDALQQKEFEYREDADNDEDEDNDEEEEDTDFDDNEYGEEDISQKLLEDYPNPDNLLTQEEIKKILSEEYRLQTQQKKEGS